MIRGIVFDAGGVLLTDKAENVYRQLARKINIKEDELLKVYEKNKDSMLRGIISAKQFEDMIKKIGNTQEDIQEMWKESYNITMKINKEVENLITELKKRYIVSIVSNAPELHAKVNTNRGLYDLFNESIISSRVGYIKPEREIFDLLLKKIKMLASECVFIDDREEHLKIPKDLGFKVIRFINHSQLKKDLQKNGVEL